MASWSYNDLNKGRCSRDDYYASIAQACNVFILSGPVFNALRNGDANLNTIPDSSWRITEESLRSTLEAETHARGQVYTQDVGVLILKAGCVIQYGRIQKANRQAGKAGW